MHRIASLFLGIGGLIALVGCATNSDGRYVDSAIEPSSPLPRYMLALDQAADPSVPDADRMDEEQLTALEHEAVFQLEDLVELAASKLAGTNLDYHTPEIGDIDFAAEVASRGKVEDYEEWYYAALYDGDRGYGVKYLLDHAGKDHAGEALDHPEAPDLAMAVDGYVLDVTPEAQSIELLREVEQRIWKSFGMTEEQWFANERNYDTAIDALGAYSEPGYGCPVLFSRCRIEIPRSMFRSSILEIIHTYGHELLHCRVGEFESRGEEHRTIEETACEVFGAKVVDQLVAMKRLDFDIDSRIFGDAPLDGALDSLPDTLSIGDADEDSEAEGSDAEDLEHAGDVTDEFEIADYVEVEAEFERLRQLYRSRDITFERWRQTQARYGYVDLEPKSHPHEDVPDIYDQLDVLFDRFGVDAVASLIPELTDTKSLERVTERASSSNASLSDLIAAAREMSTKNEPNP